jgi:DNA repair protein RecO (recombination protein O)
VPGTTVKTEAIVLRSIRFGEADRILHLYSKTRGRFGAIAKGARKPRSRFGWSPSSASTWSCTKAVAS